MAALIPYRVRIRWTKIWRRPADNDNDYYVEFVVGHSIPSDDGYLVFEEVPSKSFPIVGINGDVVQIIADRCDIAFFVGQEYERDFCATIHLAHSCNHEGLERCES